MPDTQPLANGARVLADLNALRAIGAYKTGVHKPTFSEPHKQSLEWLALMKEELGDPWLRPSLFRIGASGLLTDIERQLEHAATGRYSAAHHHPMP